MTNWFEYFKEFISIAFLSVLVTFIILCTVIGAIEIFGSGEDCITYKVQIKCDNFESYINYKYISEEEIIDYVDDYDCKSIVVINMKEDTIFLRK